MWFCILLSLCCIIRYECYKREFVPTGLPWEEVTLQGRIDSFEIKDDRTILYLSNVFFYGNSATEISNRQKNIGVRCYVDGIWEGKLGQQVAVQGFLSLPEGARNPGEFDSVRYYGAKGYDYLLTDGTILAQGDSYDVILQFLYELKVYGKEKLQFYLNTEDAGIMVAMLLGDKEGLHSDVKDLYRSSGIYHILSISGMHISVIGGCLYQLLLRFRLPRFWAALGGMIGIVGYGCMIGMPPSAFRAIVMYAFGLAAGLALRSHDRFTSLSVACACLLVCEPVLWQDGGFQLSFTAVLGIISFYPTFLNPRQSQKKYLDGVWISFAVTYFTLPLLMNSYYEIPLYSLLVNFCILPYVPLLMGLGMMIIGFGGWFAIVAEISAWLIHMILFFYEKILEFFQSLPGSNLVTGAPPVWKITIFYVVLAGMIWGIQIIKRKMYLLLLKSENAYEEGRQEEYLALKNRVKTIMKRVHMGEAGVMLVLLCMLLWNGQERCKITFLDVGQGDGICMESGFEVFLIDGGNAFQSGIGEYTLVPFLKHQGITEIDAWFLTHPDSDHVSGFLEICGQLQKKDANAILVKRVYIPAVLEKEFAQIVSLAKECGVEIVLLEQSDEIEFGEGKITVLSPAEDVYYSNENAASLVLYLEMGEMTGLFMGDGGVAAERIAMENEISNLTLLKVGHHGSAVESNAEAFISQMNPRLAVISCGENNRYGHPHVETLERLHACGSMILRTDESGAVIVKETWRGMVVDVFCK